MAAVRRQCPGGEVGRRELARGSASGGPENPVSLEDALFCLPVEETRPVGEALTRLAAGGLPTKN